MRLVKIKNFMQNNEDEVNILDCSHLSRKATPAFFVPDKNENSVSNYQPEASNELTPSSRNIRKKNIPPKLPSIKIESLEADELGTPNLPSRKFSFMVPHGNMNRVREENGGGRRAESNVFLKPIKSHSHSDPEGPEVGPTIGTKVVLGQNQIRTNYGRHNCSQEFDLDCRDIRESRVLTTIEDVPSELSYTCFMKDLKAE